jgi:hypothetical protein
MNVAFIGGHWSANIGNAYYNIGAIKLLENVVGPGRAHLIPDPPQWRYKVSGDFDLIANLDVDLVLFGGPILNLRMEEVIGKTIRSLVQRGVKWGFLSAGMALYTNYEKECVNKFLEMYPPICLLTRDAMSYQFFKDINCEFIYNGICTSMFLSDAFQSPAIKNEPYIVANLDHAISERGIHAAIENAGFSKLPIIWAASESVEAGAKLLYKRDPGYHSDLPFGYMSLFKSAQAVFSDRVHSCAACLALGGQAQYLVTGSRSAEHRRSLFERLNLRDIFSRPVSLDMDFVAREKAEMKLIMREIIKEISGE